MVVSATFAGCGCADASETASPHPRRLPFLDDPFRAVWSPNNSIESFHDGDSGWPLTGLRVLLWWYQLLSRAVIVLIPERRRYLWLNSSMLGYLLRTHLHVTDDDFTPSTTLFSNRHPAYRLQLYMASLRLCRASHRFGCSPMMVPASLVGCDQAIAGEMTLSHGDCRDSGDDLTWLACCRF
jgi:hypothetical protein